MNTALSTFIKERISEIKNLPEGRIKKLDELKNYINSKIKNPESVQLNFICTHNSRRSHLGQIWSKIMADYFNIPKILTYSGGTEVTALNENVVNAIKKAGITITNDNKSPNPVYSFHYNESSLPIIGFSKVYNDKANPSENFCAIMTCTDADEKCPFIEGAEKRISLPYEDPKLFDNTPLKEKMYEERSKQIATEMAFVFSTLEGKG